MPRSVVFGAALLDEDELATIDELELELDFILELLVATDELDFTLELLLTTDELLLTLELDTAIEELDLTLELVFTLDEDTPVPDVGIEHSLALLLGIGSEPKVATLQLNVPFNTL